jgi:hypothetical protein
LNRPSGNAVQMMHHGEVCHRRYHEDERENGNGAGRIPLNGGLNGYQNQSQTQVHGDGGNTGPYNSVFQAVKPAR